MTKEYALPHFLCVGAAKAGTTTLHDILARHPDIDLPGIKEVHYFDNDENYRKGLSWYGQHFAPAGRKLRGEITPSYMSYDYVPERIFRDLGPTVKLIFLLRNPVDRAYSEYLHNLRRGLIDDLPFDRAIKLEFERQDLPRFARRTYSFISRGLYAKQIRSFLEFFPKENMRFILFEEEFVPRQRATVRSIQDFLGVTPVELASDLKSNQAYSPRNMLLQKILYRSNGVRDLFRIVLPFHQLRKRVKALIAGVNQRAGKPETIDPDLKRQLMQGYAEDIAQLSALIGKDLSGWGGKAEAQGQSIDRNE